MTGAALFTSCQSKEERVINNLEKLADRINEDGEEFTDEDWEEAATELAKIQEEASDCNFDKEQSRQFGRAEAKVIKATVREGGKNIGRRLRDAFDQGAGMLEGFAEGISEGDADDAEFDEALKDLEDAAEGFVQGILGE